MIELDDEEFVQEMVLISMRDIFLKVLFIKF